MRPIFICVLIILNALAFLLAISFDAYPVCSLCVVFFVLLILSFNKTKQNEKDS
jgi:hypothetical protein